MPLPRSMTIDQIIAALKKKIAAARHAASESRRRAANRMRRVVHRRKIYVPNRNNENNYRSPRSTPRSSPRRSPRRSPRSPHVTFSQPTSSYKSAFRRTAYSAASVGSSTRRKLNFGKTPATYKPSAMPPPTP